MSVSVCVGLWPIIRVICLPCEMRSLFLWGEICGLNTYLFAARPRCELCGELLLRTEFAVDLILDFRRACPLSVHARR
jgi:hypothetical protein